MKDKVIKKLEDQKPFGSVISVSNLLNFFATSSFLLRIQRRTRYLLLLPLRIRKFLRLRSRIIVSEGQLKKFC